MYREKGNESSDGRNNESEIQHWHRVALPSEKNTTTMVMFSLARRKKSRVASKSDLP